MFNPSIESILRHELDSLPLPPQSQWVPERPRTSGWRTTLWFATGIAVVAVALIAGPMLRDWRESQRNGVAARPTPLVLPTVVDGRLISPLSHISQHPELGFNLVLPANWRDTGRWTFSGRSPAPIAGVTYTAQTPEMEGTLLNRYGTTARLPWDVVVEVWAAGGMTASDWARERGGCAAGCTRGTTTIHGTEFVTSVDSATGAHAFYVLRGSDRILVLSYVVGAATEQPQGVTADTLDQIVRSVGLP